MRQYISSASGYFTLKFRQKPPRTNGRSDAQCGSSSHLVLDPPVFGKPCGRQRPFGHLAVAAIGQIDFAHRRHVVERLGQRGRLDPLLVLHQGVEKLRQPAVVVDVFVGFRPGAELLAVVAEDGHRVGVLVGQFGEIVDRLLRTAEGDRIAEPLAAGKHREHAALVFRQQVAREFRLAQAGTLEVEVVQHGVFDAGVDQIVGQSDCSQTRSGTHRPRIVAPRRFCSQRV